MLWKNQLKKNRNSQSLDIGGFEAFEREKKVSTNKLNIQGSLNLNTYKFIKDSLKYEILKTT